MKKIVHLLIVILAIFLAYHFQFDVYLAEAGVITVYDAKDLNKVIDDLRPGYTLVVKPGIYRLSTWNIRGLHGNPGAMITIKAEGKVVIEGYSQTFNVVEMENVSYLNFEGFEIRSSAQTLGGIDGISIVGELSHHIGLNKLNIHNVSGRGVKVWASEAYNVDLSGSEIHDCGSTGVVFGHPDKYIVRDSQIKNNYIHHCPKEADRRGYYGIQIREGSFRNMVEGNVLHDVGSPSKAGISVYYGKSHLSGNYLSDINVVRNNILWNGRDQGIAAISDALIENNTVFNTDVGLALMAYFENESLTDGQIENLTVRGNSIFSCPEACVHIYDWSETAPSVSFANNLVYQGETKDYAIRGADVGGHFEDNIYYGVSDVIDGASLAENTLDFAKILSLTRDPNIGLSDSLQLSLSQAINEAKIMPVKTQQKNGTLKPGQLKNNVEEVTLAEASEIFNFNGTISLGVEETKIYENILKKAKEADRETSRSLAQFIHEGTLTTEYLGAGERAGAVDSYLAAFSRLPKQESEWQDAIKIANGRWPSEKNLKLEEEIKREVFTKIYKREPDMDNPNDNAAVTIITYGLRPGNRNTKNEKTAIKSFESIFGYGPSTARDWNIVRAIAYSGAKR